MSATTTPPRRRTKGRARLADATYVVLGILFTGALVADTQAGHGNAAAVAATVTNLAATAALLLRRTRPLLPVLAAVPGMLITGGDGLLPLAVLALAIRRRDRVLVAVGVGGFLLAVVASVVQGLEPVTAAIGNAVTLALTTAVGAYVGARRDLVASLRARAEQAEEQVALRSDQARLAERTRIAREMHDVLAHRISLIGLHAGGLEVAPASGPEVVERSATLIRETAHAALEDLRGVLGVLRADASTGGAELAPQPRLEDLPQLVASSAAAGVTVTLHDELPGEPVDERVGRTVYRVAQEALTNVHKHAGGAAATVRLTGGPGDGLVVEVANVRPVGGGPVPPGAGVGLVGLRERVALAGGRLEAGPTEAGGWRVAAWFPWQARSG